MRVLTLLTAAQVLDNWSDVADSIEKSLPPFVTQDEDTMAHILAAVMQDRMFCFTALNGGGKPILFITTTIVPDAISGSFNLLIYSLYTTIHVKDAMFEEGTEDLLDFARSKNCNLLIAYSSNIPLVKRMLEKGWKGEYAYLTRKV